MRENLARRIDGLPPDLQNEVEDFVEFLWEKKTKKLGGKPNFSWGAPSRI
jgi:hypothetical protein